MTEPKDYLTTEEVSKLLGLHRNIVTGYKEKLQPFKAPNGRDNRYKPEIVEAFQKEREEKNPSILYKYQVSDFLIP